VGRLAGDAGLLRRRLPSRGQALALAAIVGAGAFALLHPPARAPEPRTHPPRVSTHRLAPGTLPYQRRWGALSE
jgi:hypothetical protein